MAKIKWDHVVHYVNNLSNAQEVFTTNGLHAFAGGSHQQWGTYNVLSYFGLTYLEFLGIEDRALAESISDPNDVVKDAVKHLPTEEILSRVALRTDDIEAVQKQLVEHGLAASTIMAGKRNDAQGHLIEWKMMTIAGDFQGLPYPFVIEWKGTDQERKARMIETGIIKEHPVGEVTMERAVFHVDDPVAVAKHWSEVFNLEVDEATSHQLQVGDHTFMFIKGAENRLHTIEFSTDNSELTGKTIKIGEGYYYFN